MEKNTFDLKSFRENSLKLSQSEFATLIGMRQDAISRMEKNPEQISLSVLQTIAINTGLTLDQLVSYKKPIPEPLKVKNTWNSCKYMKNTLLAYTKNYLDTHGTDLSTDYQGLISNVKKTVNCTILKPQVVFIGRSDSGKSTMINSLIGREKMPTNWTPTTSISVYIKHIEDRPSFIGDELWIFKKGKDDESWDSTRLADEKYCREWKIAGGSAEMLASYGTRHGENYQSDNVGSAVLFIDSDILHNCDLVDVPGFTGGIASDNAAANKAKSKADVLVYLSQSSGFLDEGDFSYLKDALQSLSVLERSDKPEIPPLANVFVVATQAHVINNGNQNKLHEILVSGCDRFYGTITQKFWNDRTAVSGISYTKELFARRFFAYTTDIPDVRLNFETELRHVIELLPKLIEEQSFSAIHGYCKDAGLKIDNDISQFKGLIEERDKYVQLSDAVKKNEPVRKQKTSDQKEEALNIIEQYRRNSKDNFRTQYDRLLSEDHIVNLIENHGFKSKKQDMQGLSSLLNSEIQDTLNQELENWSKEFSKAVEKYINNFSSACTVGNVGTIHFQSDFNAKRAFVSGLAGVTTLGGLAIWASTLGNLGAYILVAKGVSILSVLGISVGGTAAAASAVASIGGPIVLGIALAVMIAIGAFSIFSGKWKQKVAKKFREAYADQDALTKYFQCIDEFWDDTVNTFKKAADTMETEWEKYISDLEQLLTNYNVNELNDHITEAEKVKSFFTDIPLSKDGMSVI